MFNPNLKPNLLRKREPLESFKGRLALQLIGGGFLYNSSEFFEFLKLGLPQSLST